MKKLISLILTIATLLVASPATNSTGRLAGGSGLTLTVAVDQSIVVLGNQVTVTGTVTNNGSGTKHITFEIISYSACEPQQHADLFYDQDYVVPGNTTRTESVTFTPECVGEWETYTAMIYHNVASEVETSYDVVP